MTKIVTKIQFDFPVDIFVLGYGDQKIQIPVFGLCPEMRSALKYSLIPLIVLSASDSLLRLFSSFDIAIVYFFTLTVIWAGHTLGDQRNLQRPQFPMLGQVINALTASTCLYLLMLVIYNSLRILAQHWLYFMLQFFLIFLLIVNQDLFEVYTLFKWLSQTLSWLQWKSSDFSISELFHHVRRSSSDDGDSSEISNRRRHSVLRLRDEALRRMSQEIDIPPPARFVPSVRRKIHSISPIRPIRSSHQ